MKLEYSVIFSLDQGAWSGSGFLCQNIYIVIMSVSYYIPLIVLDTQNILLIFSHATFTNITHHAFPLRMAITF